MKYSEWNEKRQKEVNELPLFFAFSNEQFKEQMEKRGLTENDTDKIYRLGGTGGFYLKTDAEKIREFIRGESQLEELMEDQEFATEAFEYEMENHEYGINWQADWDVCDVFCKVCEYGEDKTYEDYLMEAGHEGWIPAYRKARKEYYRRAEEYEWF